jgi:hypothetical protein
MKFSDSGRVWFKPDQYKSTFKCAQNSQYISSVINFSEVQSVLLKIKHKKNTRGQALPYKHSFYAYKTQ